MDKELAAKIVEILGSIQTAVGKAADFTIEQLPDIAQSYVVYGRVACTASLFVALATLGIGLWASVYKGVYGNIQKPLSDYGWWSDARVNVTIAGMFLSVLAAPFVFTTGREAALVWFAPKVWLLKELAAIVK